MAKSIDRFEYKATVSVCRCEGPHLADSMLLHRNIPNSALGWRASAKTATANLMLSDRLDFSLLGDLQRILDLNTQISNCDLQLGVPEQQLDCPQILGSN
jgi:hypothetical protein